MLASGLSQLFYQAIYGSKFSESDKEADRAHSVNTTQRKTNSAQALHENHRAFPPKKPQTNKLWGKNF